MRNKQILLSLACVIPLSAAVAVAGGPPGSPYNAAYSDGDPGFTAESTGDTMIKVNSTGPGHTVNLIRDGRIVSTLHFEPGVAWFDNLPVRFECAGGGLEVSVVGEVYLTSELSEQKDAFANSWRRLTARERRLFHEWGEALTKYPNIADCTAGLKGASKACNEATIQATLAVAAAAATCLESGGFACPVAAAAAANAIRREWEICLQ